MTVTVTVTRKFFFGDGDGYKKVFFGDSDGEKKIFSVRVTVDSTRDTPSCLKNFEKTRGVFRPSLSNFVFRNLLEEGGGEDAKTF